MPQASSGHQERPKGPENGRELDVILLVKVPIRHLSTGIIMPVVRTYFKVQVVLIPPGIAKSPSTQRMPQSFHCTFHQLVSLRSAAEPHEMGNSVSSQ
jgi:hypothetical protein